MELGNRLEVQEDLACLLSFNGPDERIGKDLQKLGSLLVIVLPTFALLVLGARIVDEGYHLLALLVFGQRLAVPLNYTLEADGMGLSDPLFQGLFRLAIYFEVKPM